MLYLKDKGDNWSWPSDDLQSVCYEDGTTEPLTTAHLVVEMGKYKGENLATITDRGYLQWMQQRSVDNDLVFVEKCIRLRLSELT